jgi:ABC transporter, permease/ATP-binding protein|nr:MAG TPA: ATP-driven flippase [Caudoviricetes sp.]
MKKIISFYLKPYYKRMGIGFAVKFTGSIMDLCIPWVLAYVIDNVIHEKSAEDLSLGRSDDILFFCCGCF